MPRVLRIMNRLSLGGPAHNVVNLTHYMAPEFETLLIGGSPLPDEEHCGFMLDRLGIRYTELPEMGRKIQPFRDLQAFLRIRRIIREFRPDIVHTHAAKAGALGRLAAWMARVPVIVHTFHGNTFSGYFPKWKNALLKMTERRLAAISSAIITISEQQFREISTENKIAPPEKTFIIPLGVDLSRFNENTETKRKEFRRKYELHENEIAIAIIGRFAPVKNHQLFFDAIKMLDAYKKNFKVFVIGDGEMKSHWRQYIGGLNSETERVIFTSWIKNMDEALAGIDIVTLTSHNEGTPVSLIEAQATGLPVVATDVGGVRDCVLDKKSGFIVSPGDATAICDALIALMNDEELRKKMGTAGKKSVNEKYAHTRLVADTARLYRILLKRKNILSS